MKTREEMEMDMARAASVMKLVCGVGNNAAWLVMLEAHDHARRCRRYRGQVKREFAKALVLFNRYSRNLLYARENRMFHVADMSPEIRKKYGDISDGEYFEFWTGLGGSAYVKTRPQLTSLWNKYRVSLLKHGVTDAEHVAWVMVAQAGLELAVKMYESGTEECVAGYALPKKVVEHVFGQFSLREVAKQWKKAMMALAPDTEGFELDETEDRNIEHGLTQLLEAWCSHDSLFDSTSGAVEDFDDVFRTKGEQKKAMREIAEIRREIE